LCDQSVLEKDETKKKEEQWMKDKQGKQEFFSLALWRAHSPFRIKEN